MRANSLCKLTCSVCVYDTKRRDAERVNETQAFVRELNNNKKLIQCNHGNSNAHHHFRSLNGEV